MMIGIVLKCDVENKNLSIGFNCVGSVEEVFVQKCEVYEIFFSDDDFMLLEDIYQFDCSEKDKVLIIFFFWKYSDVFFKNDDDIGCIDIV